MNDVTKHVLIRLFMLLFIILVFVALFFIGIYVGYVVLGKGPSSQAFNPEIWQHILDFIK